MERMPADQEEIYYVLGENVQSVALSPHLDPFKERGLEVLLLIDAIDPFITPLLSQYKEKKLRNIDESSIELPEIDEEEADGAIEVSVPDVAFNQLVGRCVTTLGDRIIEVRESRVLKSSPVRLVSPEDGPGSDMERLQRYMDKEYEVPKRILELNRSHTLVVDLAQLVEDNPGDPLIDLTIEQLYEGALVMEGLHPSPASMLPRIQQLMEIAAAQALDPQTE
jgi:molecular chaperone HtpG